MHRCRKQLTLTDGVTEQKAVLHSCSLSVMEMMQKCRDAKLSYSCMQSSDADLPRDLLEEQSTDALMHS